MGYMGENKKRIEPRDFFLLEYNQSQGLYHYNYLERDEGTFHNPFAQNGWEPVCIIPEDLTTDEAFLALLDMHSDAPVDVVREKVIGWVLNYLKTVEASKA